MHSSCKTAALVSAAVIFQGCGDNKSETVEAKQKVQTPQGGFLAKEVDDLQKTLKSPENLKNLLKAFQSNVANSELVAAAYAAAENPQEVNSIVAKVRQQVASAEGCANTAVKDGVEKLATLLKDLKLNSSEDAKAKLTEAMGSGKKAVVDSLGKFVNEKQIETLNKGFEDLIKTHTGVEIDTHLDKVLQNGLQLLNGIVDQGKGYEDQLKDAVKHIDIQTHLAGTPFHGKNPADIEKSIHSFIGEAAKQVQKGLSTAQKSAQGIMNNRNEYISKMETAVKEAVKTS